MWMTPMMTDIFILYEFRKVSLLLASPQTWEKKQMGVVKKNKKL